MIMNNGVFQMLRQRFTTTKAMQLLKYAMLARITRDLDHAYFYPGVSSLSGIGGVLDQ
ncbi:Uncharacterised protein [Enterobacter hormaechei]|nr:Uncharacterised protein [Enterobacter hormaechei]